MSSLDSGSLLAREGIIGCATTSWTKCNAPSLPNDFCCPPSSPCLAFNSGASRLCCPSGTDCRNIAPISCNLAAQNATANPQSQLLTTDLTTPLKPCGNACCPNGTQCKANVCVLPLTDSLSTTSAAATLTSHAALIATSDSVTPSSDSAFTSTTLPPLVLQPTQSATPSAAASTQAHSLDSATKVESALGVSLGILLLLGLILPLIRCMRWMKEKKQSSSVHSHDFHGGHSSGCNTMTHHGNSRDACGCKDALVYFELSHQKDNPLEAGGKDVSTYIRELPASHGAKRHELPTRPGSLQQA